ncbi:hypothetical protein Droror1_Dr00012179 [Drosera rotundifolia]
MEESSNTQHQPSPADISTAAARSGATGKSRIGAVMDASFAKTNAIASASSAGLSRLQRYPLRSSLTKPIRDKSPDLPASSSSSAATRRGESATISQSVSGLDVKQKSVNTPGRQSTQAKSGVSSNTTPRSEASVRKSVMSEGKSDPPVSDVNKSSTRKRLSVISSATYWIKQIDLSAAVGEHSISLGFFKLALDAEAKPLHMLRDNLRSYVQKHNLTDLGDTLTALLESYELSQNLKQLRISDSGAQVVEKGPISSDQTVPISKPMDMESSQTSSAKEPAKQIDTSAQVAKDGAQSSDQAAPSLNPSTGTKKLKANPESSQASSAKESSKQAVKKADTVSKIRVSMMRSSGTLKPSAESESHKVCKKVQKPKEKEPEKRQVVAKKKQKEPAAEPAVEPVEMDTTDEDKENMNLSLVEKGR